jgi:malate dehydrogenase (oxaloacetate-decarboxylating)(NADP+)
VPGQANNAYIFPGVGLGVIASGASRVTDGMFMVAARTLADMASTADLDRGCIFPPIERIREISAAIATAVAAVAVQQGVATERLPENVGGYIESLMYRPSYDA